ncbi:hypothetical protein F358_112 [Campylobacter phage F358]|uniref:Uncharacterized protein n=13 Tax=Fletchervirus TaxID=1636618 RepID=A0A7T3N2M4_9CAUD|nr:hypothetical protein F207_108 [Campylobacter phage F207]QPX63254.1 hypothetical protein F348_118 [Campylobacter phage F348]QPX63419.1 hypothetical protein F352_115 [Campylobacter phage F352]QPX63920.1 hypothetical protein F357_113 [Campylobacter phage F357]QPX64083.1 hypothetical protein F358_112 [Campylobacter phage F358]QPX64246.1 hypothetical protein F360_113 [Campylobacter phage F360]QPX64411.1 hypothetical protein F361_114 [Campylobacter phage F361]QPX64575.1 hypothetical protein F36
MNDTQTIQIFDLIGDSQARDYIAIKAYKIGSDVSGIKDSINDILDDDPSKVFDNILNMAENNISNIINPSNWEAGPRLKPGVPCEYIWILPIPSSLAEAFSHEFNQDEIDPIGDMIGQ